MPKLKKIGLFYNQKKQKEVSEFFPKLIKWTTSKKIKTTIFDEWPKTIPNVDIAIVFGGDGTILRAGRYFAGSNIPILGINLGRLGFLAEVQKENSILELTKILSNKQFNTQPRALFDVQIKRNNRILQKYLAVNDIVIKNSERARVIDLDVFCDNEFIAKYTGDGVIIATPTGSTAYSLAAGGPILDPTTPVFILCAICPHTLALRPLILNDNKNIRVAVIDKTQDTIISIDGQITQKLLHGDEILIKKSKQKMIIMLTESYSHFEILRKKLGWGNR